MMASISDVAVLLRNGKSIKQSAEAGGLPITRIETIADWTVNQERVGFADLRREDCEDWLLQDGDILISHINSTKHLGKCAMYEGVPSELVHGMNLLTLRVDRRLADAQFIHRVLASPGFRSQLPRITKDSVNQSSFNISNFKKLQIPLPHLAVQKRIAGILDAADALRAKRRESLAELDTLLQATFLDMFGDPVTNPMGWKIENFENIIFFQEGPGVRKWQFRDTGIKLVNVKNIVAGELHTENTNRHLDPDEVAQKYRHFLLDEGDLVMSSSGVTWGKIAYVENKHLPLCLNTSMIRLRPKGTVITHPFIRTFIESQSFRRQIHRLITGSAQPNFGPSHLKKISIGLPPFDLQQRFATIVESIEQQKDRLRAHLAELDTLFASLQQRAFNGER